SRARSDIWTSRSMMSWRQRNRSTSDYAIRYCSLNRQGCAHSRRHRRASRSSSGTPARHPPTGYPLGMISEFSSALRSVRLLQSQSVEQTVEAQTTIQARRPTRVPAHIAAQVLTQVQGRRRIPAPMPQMLFGSLELAGIPVAYDRNAEIYGEGELADYVYKLVRGAVRTYKVLTDGRRQINAF